MPPAMSLKPAFYGWRRRSQQAKRARGRHFHPRTRKTPGGSVVPAEPDTHFTFVGKLPPEAGAHWRANKKPAARRAAPLDQAGPKAGTCDLKALIRSPRTMIPDQAFLRQTKTLPGYCSSVLRSSTSCTQPATSSTPVRILCKPASVTPKGSSALAESGTCPAV